MFINKTDYKNNYKTNYKTNSLMIATENKEEIEQKIVVIGKVLPNRWEYKQIEVIGNKEIEETGIIVVGDNNVKEINRNRLYLQLIIEIFNYFANTTGYKVIISIPDLFVAECVENWISKWKENEFFIDKEKTINRPNRDLLLTISNLKDQMKREIHVLFNYRL